MDEFDREYHAIMEAARFPVDLPDKFLFNIKMADKHAPRPVYAVRKSKQSPGNYNVYKEVDGTLQLVGTVPYETKNGVKTLAREDILKSILNLYKLETGNRDLQLFMVTEPTPLH
jgi:hypothetical protein